MAVNLYSGYPGSGKSYEVVSSVIVPALKAGRRVLTDIAGINDAEIYAHLVEGGADRAKLGQLVVAPPDSVGRPGFFPTEEKPEALVKPGDLVVVDEAWRYWSSGCKLSEEHYSFFRYHRHFVDAKGVSCDLVLITQDAADIDRKVRAVVELHVRMTKLKAIGRPKNYRVEIFSGAKARGKAQQIIIRKYDAKVFALYSSYEGKGGDERTIDGRQNMLRGGFFRVVLPAVVLLGVGGFWFVYRFLSPAKAAPVASDAKAVQQEKGAPAASVALSPAGASVPVVQTDSGEKVYLTGVITREKPFFVPTFLLEVHTVDSIRSILIIGGEWRKDGEGYSVKYRDAWVVQGGAPVRVANRAPEVGALVKMPGLQ